MPYADLYRPDRLFLPQQTLLNAARELPTPFYLYDADGISKTARTIQGSFRWNSGHKPYFPMKANCAPAVLGTLHDAEFGVLAQSVQELLLADQLGFAGQEILFHTPAMTQEAANLAMRLGAGVSFDDPAQMERFEVLPELCLLRYHPAKNRNAALYHLNSDKHSAGMSREQIVKAALLLADRGVKRIGLSCHLASNSMNENYYPAAAGELFTLAAFLYQEHGLCVSCCDPGGGIGFHALPREPMLNLPHIGTLVREKYFQTFQSMPEPALFTELGRYAVGRHGLLISRVVEVRERVRRYVILDASVAYLPQLLLQRTQSHISVVGSCSRKDRVLYSVHGCSGDARDRFSDCAMLSQLHPGDLVAIHVSGAYAQSMQMQLNLLPQCPGYIYTKNREILSADRL